MSEETGRRESIALRSKLFVPGSRPDFFSKALAGEADALSFDLEDAVPADGKAAARERLLAFLTSDAARATSKTVIVRVNGPDTPHFMADVAAFAHEGIDLINLPKIEDADALGAAAEAVSAAAEGKGSAPPRLLVNIETPRALARAALIATAHPMVAGLQVGLNDLFAPLAIDRRERDHVHAALWTVRMAAGEARCPAYDGAWPDIADDEGFRAEAELARSLGYDGKSCIHPRQIAIANAVFGGDDGEAIAHARRVVAAARDAKAEGRGAFALEGEMIDRPAIARAEALLAANAEGERR